MQGIGTRANSTAGATAVAPSKKNAPTPSAEMVAAAATEASKMLEAALQQMDGIISHNANSSAQAGGGDSSVVGGNLKFGERSMISAGNVLSTAKTLALALQQVGLAAPTPDAATAATITNWLALHTPAPRSDELFQRLQRDNNALVLEYQQLTDRLAEQTSKVIELEGLLNERTQQLGEKEEQLQRHMLSSSTLETQKLELMTALSELKLHRAALEKENMELRSLEAKLQQNGNGDVLEEVKRSHGSMGNLNKVNCFGGSAGAGVGVPKTPPASLRHKIQPQFHSLPRSHTTKVKTNNTNNINNNNSKANNQNPPNRSFDSNANAGTPRQRNVAFASNEKILIEDLQLDCTDAMYRSPESSSFRSQSNSTPSPNLRERAKGLKNIFGKLRRSNSGNLEFPALEQAEHEFKRGGARATAGGRIEFSTPTSLMANMSKDYANWNPQEVCNWLCSLDLGCYEEECRKWLKANPSISFFSASPVDIERELNLKTPLHRKKIQLAIDDLTGKEVDPLALKAAQLDGSWVMRWLDDIGLPQYKDTFLLAKIDGRMLHRLTMEDLAQLHVHSCLHIASLRRGIQCMRQMEWNPECLIRRSTKSALQSGDDQSDELEASLEDTTPECIALWTAHRVMEWLRVADLSEYAPNLRGAGVHGALMLYEPRFTADLLADLLSIPPSKTLLRRHLATHFKELLGRETIQIKRDAESSPNYQPLTISAKIKPPKKTQFTLKRRKSNKGSGDVDWTDYVCPMGTADKQEKLHVPQKQENNNASPTLSQHSSERCT